MWPQVPAADLLMAMDISKNFSAALNLNFAHLEMNCRPEVCVAVCKQTWVW